ncbi:MAG: hypothetical protein IPG93_26270, partial [Burkholderiales bacterium]|nr:hypothetical protein [Burkholderiales bacterium]
MDIRYGGGELGAPDGRSRLRLFEDRWVVLAARRRLCAGARRFDAEADLLRAERLRNPLVGWSALVAGGGLAEGWPSRSAGRCSATWASCWKPRPSGLGVALCSERLSRRWVAEGR